MGSGRLLEGGEGDAGLDDGSAGERVESDDPTQAGRRYDHRIGARGGAAGDAGPPALRHDGDLLLAA